jgi:hypothetical protein
MQIKTQPFKEALEIKNTGIAFDIYGNGAKRIGDLAVTKNGLVWNGGKTQRANAKGVTVKWDDFIGWMQSQTQSAPKTKITTKPRAANGKKPAARKAAVATAAAPAKTARTKKAH